MPDSPILVCGSIAYDHVLEHNGLFSEVLLPDQLQNLSVCFLAPGKKTHFGGCGGNIAYNLSLLGEKPLLLGVMGQDSSLYEDWLSSRNINLDNVKKIAEADMACAFITSDTGKNQITFFHPGASAHEFTIDLFSFKDKVSLAIISPDNADRMAQLVAECEKQAIPYFFDPGQQLPALDRAVIEKALISAEGIFVNEYELQLLLKKLDLTKVELLSKIKILITTLGEKGSVIETEKEVIKIAVIGTKLIADPTGCGDAYRAGFLKGFKDGKDLKTCGQMGAVLAAYNLEQHGTQRHGFEMEEFDKKLREINDQTN